MKKCSYDVDWQQKGIRYGLAKLDNGLSQNVQDIQRSHKVYREKHGELERGIDNRKKKFNWGGKPDRYIPGRYAITITINNSCLATQLHKMHRGLQTSKSVGKDQSPNVYRRHRTVCQKWKRIENSNTGSENIVKTLG